MLRHPCFKHSDRIQQTDLLQYQTKMKEIVNVGVSVESVGFGARKEGYAAAIS